MLATDCIDRALQADTHTYIYVLCMYMYTHELSASAAEDRGSRNVCQYVGNHGGTASSLPA